MNQQAMHQLTLYDLLARSWDCRAAIEAVCFSADGAAAVFAIGDGSLAIAATKDAEPAETRIRTGIDDGRSTIRRRAAPPSPLTLVTSQGGRLSCPVPFGGSDFLIGSQDGHILHMAADGQTHGTAMAFDAPIVAFDHNQKSGTTVASDGVGVLYSGDLSSLSMHETSPTGAIGAVALSPDGRHLAMTDEVAVTISLLGAPRDEGLTVPLPASAASLVWSPDGRWLACAMGRHGLCLVDVTAQSSTVLDRFPAPVRCAAFNASADALVAAGAFRITAWSMASPPMEDPRSGAMETGRRGMVTVDRVAAHPTRKLVAAAYENGQIVFAQLGLPDELVLRPAGTAVTAMAWSADGEYLAVGTADGTAALIDFPSQIFK
ncbi:WD40 repeat domain-containing protein [Jiella pelagia]|uniref:WD40 repeat domain-containing protein n=1 Tax=Jiella pelagia TaxID=2986949 RepID=A0ABY7BW12_9HYPH|nr:WD40 repeat domain-containing protein [Jiella pelagia]WAP67553.1 WD40 repeat domain-containing protein [Jiella pelagia]